MRDSGPLSFDGLVEWAVLPHSTADSVWIHVEREHADGAIDETTCAIVRSHPTSPYYALTPASGVAYGNIPSQPAPVGEPDLCGPISGLWTERRWVWDPGFATVYDASEQTVTVGTTEVRVQAGRIRGGTTSCTDPRCNGVFVDNLDVRMAEGIGPIEGEFTFSSNAASPYGQRNDVVESRLIGAEVGGLLYGDIQPVTGEPDPQRQPMSVRLGPIPTRESVTVWVDTAPGAPEARLDIVDALGRVVRTVNRVGEGAHRLDVRELAPGIYTVRIEASGAAVTTRLVIVR